MRLTFNPSDRQYELDTAIAGWSTHATLAYYDSRKSIVLTLHPMEVESDAHGRITVRKFTFGDYRPFRVTVATLPRYSAKTLTQIATRMDDAIYAAAHLWPADQDGARAVLAPYLSQKQ